MAKDFIYTINSLIEVLEDIAAWHQLDLGHGERTAILAVKMAHRLEKRMNSKDLVLLDYAARIHDLGRIAIDDAIMTKSGPLTTAERGAVETHTIIGYNFLARSGLPKEITETVLYHHEHFDGTGYPARLLGADIPLFPKIVCIADMFDALISERPYRSGMPVEVALNVMNSHAHWFDPYLYSIFLEVIHEEERK